jgi:hypothetical protein
LNQRRLGVERLESRALLAVGRDGGIFALKGQDRTAQGRGTPRTLGTGFADAPEP